MSESVKNYPPIRWTLPGMRPLQVGIVTALVFTSLAGILSNPLFTLANDSVDRTPMLQPALRVERALMAIARPSNPSNPSNSVE